MKNASFTIVLFLFFIIAGTARGQSPSPAAQPQVETIMLIRHGEKPADWPGQAAGCLPRRPWSPSGPTLSPRRSHSSSSSGRAPSPACQAPVGDVQPES